MRNADRIVSFIFFIFGVFVLVTSLEFDYMVEGTPGPGFVPFWVGLSITILSISLIIRGFSKQIKETAASFALKDFKPFVVFIGGGVIVVILTPFLGFLIPLGAMVGATAKLMGTKSLKVCAALAILTPLAMFVVFDLVLGVPLPKAFWNV